MRWRRYDPLHRLARAVHEDFWGADAEAGDPRCAPCALDDHWDCRGGDCACGCLDAEGEPEEEEA